MIWALAQVLQWVFSATDVALIRENRESQPKFALMKLIRTHIPWNSSRVRVDDIFTRALEELGGFTRTTPVVESTPNRPARSHLAADVFEDDHHYYFRLEIPGAQREDIAVRFEDGVLSVAYQSPDEDSGARPAVGFESRLSLSRAFRLPGPVDANRITAKLDAGILTVTVPRSEAAKPKVITIE